MRTSLPKKEAKEGASFTMYELLTGIFFTIFALAVYGMLKYGFNIVFVYIGLFSLLIIVWGMAAVLKERKGNQKDEQD